MKIIIVSHGSFANGATESLEMICGKSSVVSIGMFEDIGEFEAKISKLEDEQTVFFADIPGGHPFNTVYKHCLNNSEKQLVVGGFNLPMLIETNIQSSFKTIEELCEDMQLLDVESIVIAKNWK